MVAAVLGPDALAQAPRRDVTTSAVTGLVVGLVATVAALTLPGVHSLRHEISQERREIPMNPVPAWRRWRLDLALLALTALAEGVAYASGAFDAPAASVSQAPLVAWFGGTLVGVRVFQTATARLPAGAAAGFGPLLRGNLVRSLRRRYGALATGTVGVGLVVALATALTVFSATYSAGKTADSAFTVGSDLRVTPDPTSDRPHPPDSGQAYLVPGVTGQTPVVATLENAVFVGPDNQDRADLAAVDPASFARTAALRDAFFVDQSASQALAALQQHPDAVLVDEDTAARYSVEVGDRVKILLARGTPQQSLQPFVVAGRFTRFPGFPFGVDVVMNLATYQSHTHLTDADFFLLKAQDGGPVGLTRAEAALREGPGRRDPVTIESTSTALNKDQSSLTALDIHGLVDLDTFFTTTMSAAALALFVFGLLLHRRREYLTLRALGMAGRTLFALVLAEGVVVVACGLLTGLPVGIGMGYLFVHILRPLFILAPVAVVPLGGVAVVALLPALAALACAAAALVTLRRLRITEVLRES
jgi:ABC-type lipoprotein release transport system permease subunit